MSSLRSLLILAFLFFGCGNLLAQNSPPKTSKAVFSKPKIAYGSQAVKESPCGKEQCDKKVEKKENAEKECESTDEQVVEEETPSENKQCENNSDTESPKKPEKERRRFLPVELIYEKLLEEEREAREAENQIADEEEEVDEEDADEEEIAEEEEADEAEAIEEEIIEEEEAEEPEAIEEEIAEEEEAEEAEAIEEEIAEEDEAEEVEVIEEETTEEEEAEEAEVIEEETTEEGEAEEVEAIEEEIAEEEVEIVEEEQAEEKALASEPVASTAPVKPTTSFISPTPQAEGKNTKLLRYPDVHRYNVVFVYGGDLWSVKTQGGTATRLTAHPGLELFPKYSPDGKWIAFTGQYDGDEQVYVIPAEGGTPKQLTFYPAQGPFPPRRGYDNIVYGWTPDGKSVLFRSMRDSNSVTELGALYTVPFDGGLPQRLPMPTAGAGDFSPDGKKIVYSPLFRDFRSWKRYEGGWAQDLAIFDLKTHDLKKIAVSPRTERDPMWIKNNKTGENDIYFVSDRGGTLNLYKYDVKSEAVKKLTDSTEWDVRWASSDGRSKIVYEFGGELKLFNTETGEVRDIPVQVPHDGLSMRASRYDVSKNIESFALSPGGKRAAIVARGDVFTVPAEKGSARNLTQTSGAHDREAVWSFDGTTIAFLSDMTGEDQIYLVDQKGDAAPEQLTDGFAARLTDLDWSPDGKFVAVKTSENKLFVVPVRNSENSDSKYEKGIPCEVVQEKNGGSLDYDWSACGQYLALTLDEESGFSSLYIWDVKTREMRRITGPNTNISSPCWDPDGKYLYYLARHEYAPQFSSVEWNYAGNRNIGLFALALRKDVPNPFAPQSDEVEIKGTEDRGQKTEEKTPISEANNEPGPAVPTAATTPTETKIDFDGLDRRVARFPLSFENYGNLSATKQFLFYVQSGAGFYGRESYEKPSIRVFDLKERKETKFADNAGSYALSPDGSKIIYSTEGTLKIANANSAPQTPLNLPTGDLAVDRVPAEEWEEIFNETCRKFRDYFYVKNMHGYDWKAICDQYRALLPYVAHRSDLNYVISEMISELNVGHAYVQGGDFTVPRRAKVGLPGARFELDTEANRYQISKIFQGQNEEPKYRAPLSEIGVDVNVGDYVLEIDGKELSGNENPYRMLQNKTNPITLTVNDKPTLEGSRKVVYQPIDAEANLLYLDFVKDRMDRVAQATDGKVGYIHIPDMGAPGAYEFIKWYYPQIRKEGLVIDVRSNGGGNISQWILMRLNQKLLGTRFGSGGKESPSTYPYTVFHGQLTCLINETSASDGDIFPYYFRKSGLGPLIGKRSWGGVVGISGRGPLIDGGEVMVPLSATNDENGKYIIEGKGVTPDIEVDNDPKSVLQGKDLQLQRGIEEVLRRIEIDPKTLPTKRPDDPVKTKEAIKKYE